MPPDRNAPAAVEAVDPGVSVRRSGGIAAGLVLITLLVYASVRGFDFVGYDDFINVYSNPHLNPVSWNGLFFFWRHSYYLLYMPMTSTVWVALAAVAGLPHPVIDPEIGPYTLDPHVFHTANLCFQILNVLLVYALLRCFVKRDWAAAAGALLFGIHPVQVEPVASVTGLNNLLSGTFAFVALRQYTLFARAEKEGRPIGQRRRHYARATLGFALALLAKPMVVTVPLMAWTLDRWMIGRPARACTRPLLAWVGMAMLCVMVTRSAQTKSHHLWKSPLLSRPLVAGDALDFYLCKLFVPLHLCPQYCRSPDWLLGQSWRFLTVIPPLLLGTAIWSLRKRHPCLLCAACLFVLGVLPVLGLMPTYAQYFSTVTDHYLYLAMLGPALLLACLLERPRPQAGGATVVVLLMLAALSWRQVGYWRDTRTLFEYTRTANPHSWLAYVNLGDVLVHEGHPDAAISDYRIALGLHPNLVDAQDDLGIIFLQRKQLAAAQACFVAALATDPMDERARVNLGTMYFQRGQYDRATELFRAVLQDYPESEGANAGLASVLAKRGNRREAARLLEMVLSEEPGNAHAHLALAILLDEQGQTDAARSHLIQAIELTPDSPEANNDYAMFLKDHGQAGLVLPYLARVVQLLPRDAQARYKLGVALGQQQRFAEAAEQFSAAISLNPRYAQAHYNLGIADIKMGHTAQAVAEWRQALAIDPSYAPARQALTRNTGYAGALSRPQLSN